MQFLSKLPKPIVIGCILLLALSLRMFHFQERGIWVDEKVTMLITHGLSYTDNGDTNTILSNTALKEKNTFENVRLNTVQDNGNAFLFNAVGHFWMKVFGDSFSVGRSISLLCSMASLFIIFLFCYRNINYNTGLLALLLMSFNPLSVAYAQEMRTYSLAIFLSLSASYLFFELFIKEEKNNSKRGLKVALYALIAALSMVAHYFTTYVYMAHVAVAIVLLRDKKLWLQFIVAGCLTLSFFSIWLVNGGLDGFEIMSYQAADYTNIAANNDGTDSFYLPTTPKNIFTGWVQVFLQEFGNGLQAFFQIRYIMFLLLLPLGLIAWYLYKNKEHKRIYVFAITVLLVQIFFATMLALKAHHITSFQPLYANFSAPFGSILLASAIIFLAQKNTKLSAAIVVIQLCISLYSLTAIYRNIPAIREENKFSIIAESLQKEYRLEAKDTIVCGSRVNAKLLSVHLDNEKEYIFKIDEKIGNKIMMQSEIKPISFELPK
jgi:uncharacterized membrane protein